MNQKVLCPSCDNTIDSEDFVRKYFSQETKTEYKLYHCKVCNLQFWFPLEFVREVYEKELVGSYDVFHTKKVELICDHLLFLRKFGKMGSKGLKLLDIGCGNGSFLHEAQKFGFDVYGIDVDSKSVKFAREELGLRNVYSMILDEFLEFNKEVKFDIITFFQLLEHQTDPKSFLRNVSKLLNDNGIVFGAVPNRNRLFARFSKEDTDFPPHHFIWFDKKSLGNLLINSGMNIAELGSVTVDFPGEWVTRVFYTIYTNTGIKFFRVHTAEEMNLLHKIAAVPVILSSIFIFPFYKPVLFFICTKK